ncbi:MAG: zinc ribbon domain-containing protein [Acidobacteria bacterium]|nr:zinc ribbon domain-containing protein [Acidobacteriota bacterium]
MSLVRHCARCDTDYRAEILTCAECGEALELRAEETVAETSPPAEPPPGDYRSLYFSDRIEDLEPLAEELTRRSIPFRIDFSGEDKITLVPHSRFDLLVREEERARAKDTLSSLPEASDLELTDNAAEKGFDPQRGYSRCPGCSAELSAGALKCPDCGLTLGGSLEPLICSACGWEVSSADSACPRCGAVLED